MKRLHVNIAVDDLDASIRFYSSLFGAEPVVKKHDYAKWMLGDPRVNFAIESRSQSPGISHLGIQAETAAELAEVRERFSATRAQVLDEGRTTCCYAESDKSWVRDPTGIMWEGFHTTGESESFGHEVPAMPAPGGCCEPTPDAGGCC